MSRYGEALSSHVSNEQIASFMGTEIRIEEVFPDMQIHILDHTTVKPFDDVRARRATNGAPSTGGVGKVVLQLRCTFRDDDSIRQRLLGASKLWPWPS